LSSAADQRWVQGDLGSNFGSHAGEAPLWLYVSVTGVIVYLMLSRLGF
jgi:hypothetical protein